MLAPAPFKTPQELGLSQIEHDALVKVLHAMERGDIKASEFSMKNWDTCICGWARRLSGIYVGSELFKRVMCSTLTGPIGQLFGGRSATVEQSAVALRAFLVHGEPVW